SIGRGVFPEAKPAEERVIVVASTTSRRKFLQPFHVAAPEHNILRFERRDKLRYYVGDVALPTSLPPLLQSALSHIFLIGGPFVGQMAKLHRFDDAVDNHRRSKPRAQAKEQHLAAFVTSQSLHRGIVNQPHGQPKRGLEIEPLPPPPEIVRLRYGN